MRGSRACSEMASYLLGVREKFVLLSAGEPEPRPGAVSCRGRPGLTHLRARWRFARCIEARHGVRVCRLQGRQLKGLHASHRSPGDGSRRRSARSTVVFCDEEHHETAEIGCQGLKVVGAC